jgi:nitrate reductase delta subunit
VANALKILSALLSYPTDELVAAREELNAAIAADAMTDQREKAWLGAIVDDLAGRDLYEAQERYVLLFDRTRTLSLHLFEHVHGESRDRGQAMVDLAQMYDAQGFEIDARELPDYLPLFLEFLSTRSEEEVRHLLEQTLHILAALRERLQRRGSVYANAFLVLEVLAHSRPATEAVAGILAEAEDDPYDLDALDEIWEDEAVTFGSNAGEGTCGPNRLRTRLRAANRPAGALDSAGDHANG